MNIRDIIKKYQIFTKKKFGQNFLVDEKLLDKIVSVSGNLANKNVLEVGPGPGGLTYSILKQNPNKLISVEIDKDCFEILNREFSNYKNLLLINDDILKVDLSSYSKLKVIANLPYNVGTNILINWLKNLEYFKDFTLLLQKEVVDRIIAKPNTKEYGRLSVLVQSLCEAKSMFDVKPENFIPPPKVMSSVVYIKPKTNFKDINIDKLSKITFALFNQRRKKIKKAVESLIAGGVIDESVKGGVDLDKRAEEISVEEYMELLSY